MSSKDAETLQGELINLRRDFEACRAASGGRHTDVTNLIRAYREEVVGLGQTAADIAVETKRELTDALNVLRGEIETLVELLGRAGHA